MSVENGFTIVNGVDETKGTGDEPWIYPPEQIISPLWFFSVRGSESLMIYLWIAKDFCWSQDFYWPSYVFGSAAISLSVYSIWLSIWFKNYYELWQGLGQFLWLFANFWWMTGELHDYHYHTYDDDYVVYQNITNNITVSFNITAGEQNIWFDKRTTDCGHILAAGLCWFALYYIVIFPFKLLPIQPEANDHYEIHSLHTYAPPLSGGWRAYENVHMTLWLAKDFAWNGLYKEMWYIFLILTLLVGIHFIICSGITKVRIFIIIIINDKFDIRLQ